MNYKQLNQPNNSQPRQFNYIQVGQTFKRPIGVGLHFSMINRVVNAKPGCGSCGK